MAKVRARVRSRSRVRSTARARARAFHGQVHQEQLRQGLLKGPRVFLLVASPPVPPGLSMKSILSKVVMWINKVVKSISKVVKWISKVVKWISKVVKWTKERYEQGEAVFQAAAHHGG